MTMEGKSTSAIECMIIQEDIPWVVRLNSKGTVERYPEDELETGSRELEMNTVHNTITDQVSAQ